MNRQKFGKEDVSERLRRCKNLFPGIVFKFYLRYQGTEEYDIHGQNKKREYFPASHYVNRPRL
jgi:hypothetical protein